jgi:hypothetical protein
MLEHALARDLERREEAVVHGEAVLGERDGRREQLGPGLLLGAELLVELPEARDTAGDADRLDALACLGLRLAVGVDVHVVGRGGGGRLAEVERAGLALDAHDGEASAADVAGGGVGDREREGGRDRGIGGVAAGGEDVAADVGRDGVVGDDHAVLGAHRDRRRVGPRCACGARVGGGACIGQRIGDGRGGRGGDGGGWR